MKTFLLTILSSFILLIAQAQQNRITGQLKTSTEATMPAGANVTLIKADDSTVLSTITVEKDGRFAFENIMPGKYRIEATMIGYHRFISPAWEVKKEQATIELPGIKLTAVVKSMSNVTVTAARPFIEHKADRMLVNVEASPTNAGANALELLEKSPGISVDREGNIQLKGKDGVQVLIDGRPTQLGASDLANLLRNMNANQLDQIEIMTNPPARYDAAGNAGIINIKTKKTKTAGYNGTVNLGYTQGRYPKITEGFNFNYRQGKVNVFGNLGHNYRKNFEVLSIQRRLRSNAGVLENYFDQRADEISESNSFNIKTGVDYFQNKTTTIGFMINASAGKSSSEKENLTYIASSSKELQNITKADVANNTNWKNWMANLNLRKVLDSAGREFTTDLDYVFYDSRIGQFMSNAYYDASGNALDKKDTLQGILPQAINVYSGRMDYIHPFNKRTRFEAGIKSSFAHTDNNARYDSIQNGVVVLDPNRSNHFRYRENINAAYINLSGTLSKKWQMQLGLRLEHTNANGHQLMTGERFSRQYTQLFPTAYLQYAFNEKHSLGINFGRRIRRPNYESLNPFIRFIDRYTYSKGNPDLRPQLSSQVELTHSFSNMIITTLNYTSINDIMQMVLEQKGRETYATQANIASLKQVGFSVSFNKSLAKWWTSNVYVNVFHNRFRGIVGADPVAFNATSITVNGSQQFKITKNFNAEISGVYRGSGVQGVAFLRPRGALSLGFSQQVMQGKGTLRLTVRDLFYTLITNASIKYGNVDAAFQEKGDTRQVAVGFAYRFSKGKAGAQRKKTTGSAGEEQERIGIN